MRIAAGVDVAGHEALAGVAESAEDLGAKRALRFRVARILEAEVKDLPKARAAYEAIAEMEGGDEIGPWPVKQAVLILGAVTIFGFAIPKLGMAIALPLLIGIGSLASGEFRIKEVLLNCIILTVSSWAIFIKGLGLTIPLWPTFLTA